MQTILPIQLSSTKLASGFWKDYQEGFSQSGLRSQWNQLVETGRIEHFHSVARGESGTFKGYRFNDSDVYKWLEAAAYFLPHYPDNQLKAFVDEAIDAIASAQSEDGYICTYVQLNHPDWKWKNLSSMHEMYCIGHLIEAAVALKTECQDARLLSTATKAADHVLSIFGPDKRIGFCGHPELEIALYRLAASTKDTKYAEFADWMIDARGQRPSPFEPEIKAHLDMFPSLELLYCKDETYDGSYGQDDLPVRDQTQIVGHSVRAAYLYTAAAWSSMRRKDEPLLIALNSIWENLVTRRMYITGGIGSAGENEGFTTDYDLPNLNAYAETCAGVALAMWGRAMFQATASTDYLEIVEKTIFNGVLSGVSTDTQLYNYENPLESRKNHTRKPWFGCACCPPNIARLVGSIAQYAYFESENTIYIAFPIAGVFEFGQGVSIAVESNYPREGTARISVTSSKPQRKRLAIRIPDWSDDMTTEFPTCSQPGEYENGFAIFDHEWSGTQILTVDFEMQPKFVEANPAVLENVGCLALQYGPTIYCVESSDLEDAPQLFTVDPEEELVKGSDSALDQSPTWVASGYKKNLNFSDSLYAESGTSETESAEMTLIPYRTWNMKGASYMQVWLRAD